MPSNALMCHITAAAVIQPWSIEGLCLSQNQRCGTSSSRLDWLRKTLLCDTTLVGDTNPYPSKMYRKLIEIYKDWKPQHLKIHFGPRSIAILEVFLGRKLFPPPEMTNHDSTEYSPVLLVLKSASVVNVSTRWSEVRSDKSFRGGDC